MRFTKTYLSTVILPLLSSPITQKTAQMLYQHLHIVFYKSDSLYSIKNRSVGQQAKAKIEHADNAYDLDSIVASLIANVDPLYSLCSSVITPYNSGSAVSDADRISIQNGVNAVLSVL